MNEKLKPCPFCGNNVKLRAYTMLEDFEGNYVKTYPTPQIECPCGINFSLNEPNWVSLDEFENETIKAWNRRVEDE